MPDTDRHPAFAAALERISAERSVRLCYLSVVESETLRRDGVETWRELLKKHRAERAYLSLRDHRAIRLAVRLMYSPQERRARDEELADDLRDANTFDEHDRYDLRAWEER